MISLFEFYFLFDGWMDWEGEWVLVIDNVFVSY